MTKGITHTLDILVDGVTFASTAVTETPLIGEVINMNKTDYLVKERFWALDRQVYTGSRSRLRCVVDTQKVTT